MPHALVAGVPSVPVQERAAKCPATDEDMLPFAFAARFGWGEPMKVKRVATLGESVRHMEARSQFPSQGVAA